MFFKRSITPLRRYYIVDITYNAERRSLSLCSRNHGQDSDPLIDPANNPNALQGFTREDLRKIHDIWNRWHMNDARPGTVKQMELLRAARAQGKAKTYEEICQLLVEAGILVDDGYRYGTDWLFEEVPKEVLKYLFSLPGTGNDWCDLYEELFISPPSLDRLKALLFA